MANLKTVKIFPPIGIARIGNSQEWYLGPELPFPAPPPVPVVATTSAPAASATALPAEAYGELQSIEDLLTGTDAERRQGLDRLHQLLRKIRPHS